RLAFGLNELSGQYTLLGILAGIPGLVILWRNLRAEALLLSLMVAGNFFFAMNYALVGYLYFIPTYLIWGIFIGVSLGRLVQLGSGLVRPAAAIATQGALAALVLSLALYGGAMRYPSVDQSGQTATRD